MTPTIQTSQQDFETGTEINLADILDTLLQHIWLIVGAVLVATAAGITYATLATPIYKADALIQIESDKVTPLTGIPLSDALGGTSPISGEIEILRSREVLMNAIAATQADIIISVSNRFPIIGEWLARRRHSAGVTDGWLGLTGFAWGGEELKLAEFNVPASAYGRPFTVMKAEEGFRILDDNGIELARGPLNQSVSFKAGSGTGQIAVAKLVAADSTRFSVTRMSPIAAYKRVRDALQVSEAGKSSNILQVSYQSPNLLFASELVNAVASAYLRQNVERRSAEADQSLRFLEEQLPAVKENVARAEEALNSFKTRTQMLSVDSTASALLSQSVAIERKRQELILQKEELTQRYKPNHPVIRAIDDQLATMDKQLETLNQQVNTLPSAQRDLLRLQRDADVSAQLYISMLNNAQQLRVAKAGTVGNVRIIDYAIPDNTPVAPKRSLIIVASALTGLILGILGTFVLRMLRPTLRDAEQAEKATGLAVYATIPESQAQQKLDSHDRNPRSGALPVSAQPQVLALLSPEDSAVESLRSLRTGLAFAIMGAQNKNIVITGPTAALGKSFIAANLSALLAVTGKRVLLVETDLRRPQLGRYFGYHRVPGLSDVLAGTASLDAVIIREPIPDLSLDVLPSGQIPPNPGELLLTSDFGELLLSFQHLYDHIILDSAPVLPVADTLAVAQHASTIFLVARSEQTTARELRDAMRKLEGVGAEAKGLIFNAVKRRRVGYGYAYRYYYGYGSR